MKNDQKKSKIHKNGLEFTSNGDGTCYVSGIGTCKDMTITIPSVHEGEKVIGIGELVFYKRENITSITIPSGVTFIGELAFYNCKNLAVVQLPESIASVGKGAFSYCEGLQDIRFTGTEEQWEAISKGENWDHGVSATVIFNFKEPIAKGSKNIPFFRRGSANENGQESKKSKKSKIIIAFSLIALLLLSGFAVYLTAVKPDSEQGGSAEQSPQHAHDYISNVTAPTCTENGYTTYTCACGESYTDTVEALGHKAGAEATCTEDSNCTVCGEILNSANGHIPGKEATCTTSQNCTVCNTELKAALGHKAGAEATCTTSQNCTVCNAKLKAALGHTPNEKWEIVTEATESANGLKIQKCSVCGEKAVVAIIPATASLGLKFTSNGDGTCYVSGIGTCTDTDIVIPSTYNGMRVTSIGDKAFRYCTGLTSITIPDSVTSIGAEAFAYCSGLTSIEIPDSVTSIGDSAFSGCSSLSGTTYNNAVYLGNSGNPHLVLWKASNTSITSCNIHSNTKWIMSSAFDKCTGLTSVTIPNSVTSIGSSAFDKCSGLTSVTIGNSVTSIGDGAFYNCSGLTSITIPDGVTSIGDGAFYNCSSLTSITIPDGVTSIGDSAFRECTGLTSITIPDSVTSIGEAAFTWCSGLTSVTIGNGVTSIGEGAFAYCSGLTSITVDLDNPNYASIDGVLFNKAITELICYPARKTGTSYTIPDSVTSIGEAAFYNCSKLTSITIPNSVTSIGNYAFRECTDLTSVTIGNSVTSIGNYAFYYCTKLTSITFNGTKAQWNAISKGTDWKGRVPATEVVCSDGTVALT